MPIGRGGMRKFDFLEEEEEEEEDYDDDVW